MLRQLTLIIGITIPTLIYFDMIDPILMMIIAVYYTFLFLVNFIGSIVLGSFCISKNEEFRAIQQIRLKLEMGDDVNYTYRMLALLIFEAFTLYMIGHSVVIVSIIIYFLMIFQAFNMFLIKHVMNSQVFNTDDDSENK